MTNISTNFVIFETIYALVLLLGLNEIGRLFLKIKILDNVVSQVSDTKYQRILISGNLILLVFFPLILFINQIKLIHFLSLFIFFCGILNLLRKLRFPVNIKKNLFRKKTIYETIVLIIIFLLFLLSLAPNTHGDSLGYHFIVAKRLINIGNYTTELLNFDSLLAGSGEIFIAIGLYFGSEQFGNLIQFSGLVSIFGIFKKIANNKNYYYFLVLLSSPIILFLCSTAKPQLFHICSSAFVFSLYFLNVGKKISIKDDQLKLLISLIILFSSINAKYVFIVSSSLIGFYIFYYSIKNNLTSSYIVIFLFIFLPFYLPIIFWKYLNFGGNFYQYFFSPLPLHLHGLKEYNQYLYRFGRHLDFVNIFIPRNLNEFTTSIGIGFLYLFFLNFKKNYVKIAGLIICAYLLIMYFFGQFTGRTLLEPYIWILLLILKYNTRFSIKTFEFICKIQVLIFIGAAVVGIYSLLPAIISQDYKDKVLSKNANGYSLFKWANTKLSKEDTVISIHKSLSLGNSIYISTNFAPYVDFNNEKSKIYVDTILEKKPKYLLTMGYTDTPMLYEFKKCVGNLIYFEKKIGRFEARNPFNRGNIYNGFIYEFKLTEFPDCMK